MNRSIIEDNSGLGYIVTRGTLIGSRGGVHQGNRIAGGLWSRNMTLIFTANAKVHERELNLTVADAGTGAKRATLSRGRTRAGCGDEEFTALL